MLNIKVQCCALLILLVVTFFYFRLPRMAIATKREYSRLLVISNLCVIADILSVIAINSYVDIPETVIFISCKLYLFFMTLVIYQELLYVNADIYKNKEVFKKRKLIATIILAVAIVLLIVLPIDYVCLRSGTVVYSFGPATTAVYIYFVFTFIAILVHILLHRQTLSRRRIAAVTTWLGVLFLSAVIQFIFPEFLLVSFGGGFGILVIFFMIENPEFGLDSESSFYNTYAMKQYIDELYANDNNFCMLSTFFNRSEFEFYNHLNSNNLFVGGTEIYILYDNKTQCENDVNSLLEHFFGQSVYVVWDSDMAENFDDLMTLFKGAQKIANLSDDKVSAVYAIDENLKDRLAEHKNAEILIKEAIDEDRVEVYYQPIYDIKADRFRGAEALARIRDKDGNLVPPAVFIPVAEEEGSIISLGKIVFEKVCKFLTREDTQDIGIHYIEINLSVVQGTDRHLAADLKSLMEKYRIESGKINLEITESGSVSSKNQLLKTMETLCDYGVGFSLDDFGTGQSNLDYMASMPVQLVKFDRSMIQSYFTSEKAKNIMDSCISMIHNLGLKIVAEGVETEEQYRCMEQQGIDFIQGFYFSKPVPDNGFIEFMKNHQGSAF